MAYNPSDFGPGWTEEEKRAAYARAGQPYPGTGGSQAYGEYPANGYPTFIGMSRNELMGGPIINRYTQEAMRTGPSRGAGLAMAEQERIANQTADQLRKQAAGEAAGAANNMAMRGGVSQGARENLATKANAAAIEEAQKARTGAAKSMASIGMEDEANRTTMMANAAGMEGQGIGRNVSQNSSKNAFNLGQYSDQMKGWAAAQQAAATANSGKK